MNNKFILMSVGRSGSSFNQFCKVLLVTLNIFATSCCVKSLFFIVIYCQ